MMSDVYCEAHSNCDTPQELFEHFLRFETMEGEGICFRTPDSPYKQGRSTLKEQYLVKLARFIREEVIIIGFKEQLMNTNAEKRNAVGMMNRRKTVGGMGKNTLGAFVCQCKDGTTIDVGTGVGLTDNLRKLIWLNKDKYIGKQITIKHKPHGMKKKLISPIFVGFRNEGF
jgi:DNA ligase-1